MPYNCSGTCKTFLRTGSDLINKIGIKQVNGIQKPLAAHGHRQQWHDKIAVVVMSSSHVFTGKCLFVCNGTKVRREIRIARQSGKKLRWPEVRSLLFFYPLPVARRLLPFPHTFFCQIFHIFDCLCIFKLLRYGDNSCNRMCGNTGRCVL